MTRRLAVLLLVLGTAGCNGGNETDGGTAECGDPDGSGGDTGDVPNLLGDWTGSYGGAFLDGNCSSDDVPKEVLDYLKQPFLVQGSPTSIRATFGGIDDYTVRGVASPTGSMAMSGVIVAGGVDLHTALGGLLYEDASGRIRWDGGAFIGADLNGDAIIDCEFRTDWSARKSGS